MSFVSWLVCSSKGAILSKPLEIQMFARFTDCVLIFIWIWIYIVWWSNYGYIKPVFLYLKIMCFANLVLKNHLFLTVCLQCFDEMPFFWSRQPRRDRHPWPNVRGRFPRTECVEPGTGTGEKNVNRSSVYTYYIYIQLYIIFVYIYI